MKISTKISLILILIICIFSIIGAISNAANMNLVNNNALTENNANVIENEVSNSNTSLPTSTQTSTEQAEPDFFTADNILNIILITIGIVLILLSIAIFIRMR